VAAAIVFVTACATEAPPEQGEQTGAAARPSYTVRLDTESSDLAEFRLIEDDDGIRFHTGPAGIAYRSEDVVTSGDVHLEATFTQFDATVGYREAFGLFVGGIDLDGPDLEYTYLLVRTTGDYLVKRRIGEITETLADWTPHAAVRRVESEGDEPVNTLAVDVEGGEVRFVVNGEVVHSEAVGRARPYGRAGVRVNHRLDVRVDHWALTEGGAS
jgi:hypothetical protein